MYLRGDNKATQLCPCGYAGDPSRDCYCSATQVSSYARKISGPLLDRIDLHVTVPRVAVDVLTASSASESSADVQARVRDARGRQSARGFRNVDLPPAVFLQRDAIVEDARKLLKRASARYALSARVQHKVLRVARTIADLAGVDCVGRAHMAEALVLGGASAEHGT